LATTSAAAATQPVFL